MVCKLRGSTFCSVGGGRQCSVQQGRQVDRQAAAAMGAVASMWRAAARGWRGCSTDRRCGGKCCDAARATHRHTHLARWQCVWRGVKHGGRRHEQHAPHTSRQQLADDGPQVCRVLRHRDVRAAAVGSGAEGRAGTQRGRLTNVGGGCAAAVAPAGPPQPATRGLTPPLHPVAGDAQHFQQRPR